MQTLILDTAIELTFYSKVLVPGDCESLVTSYYMKTILFYSFIHNTDQLKNWKHTMLKQFQDIDVDTKGQNLANNCSYAHTAAC